jgi:nucleotide-binding universal stress UspA family protein
MVQVVDDEGVGVAWVSVEVRMPWAEIGVDVLDHVRVGGRPDQGRGGDPGQREGTQSRLRQMIFGGATSHILRHAEVPVFMAH